MGRGQAGFRWVGGVWLNPDGTPAHNRNGTIPKPPREKRGRPPAAPSGAVHLDELNGARGARGAPPIVPPGTGQTPAAPSGSTPQVPPQDLVGVLRSIDEGIRACQNELHGLRRAVEERTPKFQTAMPRRGI